MNTTMPMTVRHKKPARTRPDVSCVSWHQGEIVLSINSIGIAAHHPAE
jgi:hypothetical protein